MRLLLLDFWSPQYDCSLLLWQLVIWKSGLNWKFRTFNFYIYHYESTLAIVKWQQTKRLRREELIKMGKITFFAVIFFYLRLFVPWVLSHFLLLTVTKLTILFFSLHSYFCPSLYAAVSPLPHQTLRFYLAFLTETFPVKARNVEYY